MTRILVWLASGAIALVVMEPWAALLHGRVWHGRLWSIHRSHHEADHGPRGAPARGWQANDVLSILHAPIAIALILIGTRGWSVWTDVAFGAGLGMTVFGAAYVVVHDGLAHERLPVEWLAGWRYLARVRAAHMVHHRGGGGPPFGLFFSPFVLRRLKRTS
jgi:beta-carotene 3-hydroxylase